MDLRSAGRAAALILTLVCGEAVSAQVVQDDFSDGDFTSNPAWTGDEASFVVVPIDGGHALRSNGPPESTTITLSTASTVSQGYWRFRFAHAVNLSNVNGSRIYLIADQPDFHSEVHGYYVQFGTNNLNRVELWRQDGPADMRTRLGTSQALVPGDTNAVVVEVTRDPLNRWTVFVDGVPVIYQATDDTYQESAALGVLVRHNATGRNRFYWTDFFADPDPGDITPPEPVSVFPAPGGQPLFVEFDESLDGITVVPEAFLIEPGAIIPTTATLEANTSLVRLDLGEGLEDGDYMLVVSGVADEAGNVQYGASIEFEVAAGQNESLTMTAHAVKASEVEVEFDRPVFGCGAYMYIISPGVHPVTTVDCTSLSRYRLHLSTALVPQAIYSITAIDVEDLSGTVHPMTQASFFSGETDLPMEREIVINEIMYAPADVASNEYLEILNRTGDRFFDLSVLRLASASSPHRPIAGDRTILGPGQFAVLVRDPAAFEAAFPGTIYLHVPGFPALLNGGDTPQIIRDDGVVIDAVPYRSGWGGTGVALERLDPAAASHHPGNWADSQAAAGGTPGEENTVFLPDVWPPAVLRVETSNSGWHLRVAFDEPLELATVSPDAFEVSGGPAVVAAHYVEEDAYFALLDLAGALIPGQHTLSIHGVADIVGNVSTESISFVHLPDLEPPVLLEARPLSATRIRLVFDEPLDQVSATESANYEISGGTGHPVEVLLNQSTPQRVDLVLSEPLTGPAFYALTVRNVADVHGNAIVKHSTAFFYGERETPEPGDIVINEIMYAPPQIHSNEWVELLNVSERAFDLAELRLSDQNSSVPISHEPHLMPPGGYVVLVRNAAAFSQQFPDVSYLGVTGFPTLLNGGDAVVLRHTTSGVTTTIDSVFYRPSWGGQGVSLERRSPDGPSRSPRNWMSSLDPSGGTPGAASSVPPDTEAPEVLAVEVAPDGRDIAILFDEPLDPTTVFAQGFVLSGSVQPSYAVYDESTDFAVTLSLPEPLRAAIYNLSITGASDLLGNAIDGRTVTFSHTPDVDPPEIIFAMAEDSVSVRVRFSEPVTQSSATIAGNYDINPAIGHPAATVFAPDGDPREVHLTLTSVLAEGVLYTLAVSGVVDLAGNVQTASQAYFILGEVLPAHPSDVVINEIMFRPAVDGAEYVELRNVSNRVIDLAGLTVSDAGPPRAISPHPVLLPPGDQLALSRDPDALTRRFGPEGRVIRMANLPVLRDAGDVVVLRSGQVVIDSVAYLPSWHRPELRDARGVSLERLDPQLSSIDPGNWTSSLHPLGGTPGLPNSIGIAQGDAPEGPGLRVQPSPFDADAGTVVRYRLASEAGLVRVRVFDAAGRLVRTLEQGRLAGAALEGELVWNGRDDSNQPLRVGIYIILLEAIDLVGARTEAYRSTVVLARRR